MSGLAGWLDFRRDLRAEQPTFATMARSIAHRGNTCGTWSDGSVALARAGRADTARADDAPAVLRTGRGAVVLALSGEIFNMAEVAARMPHIAARAGKRPEEVLLHVFLQEGIGFVEHLRGAFALAIWDGREQQLLLVRDRMGVQPLYYAQCGSALLFGSEPKALLANPLFRPRLKRSSVAIALQPRLALPGETPLEGLHEVPPAHVLTFRDGLNSSHRYWKLRSAPHKDSFEGTAAKVRSLLADAVAEQAAHGGRGALGAMLSGGLDSTSVAALAKSALRARGRGGDLRTFCVHFEEPKSSFVPTAIRPDIDSPYAALAAEHIGSAHRTVRVGSGEIATAIAATRSARDLPGWGQLDASMLVLFRAMRRSCTQALTGEIADELFGGYPQFFDEQLIRRRQFPWLDEGPRLGSLLARDLFPDFDPASDEFARYQVVLADVPRLEGEEPVNARMREVLYVSMAGRLAVLLDRMDRMSMAAGVQVRFPFCDHRLVEYVWNVPWSMKAHQGMKGLLKAAVGDALPMSTLQRKKSAYPHIQDAGYDEALLSEARSVAEDPGAATRGLFDAGRLDTFLKRMHDEGRSKKESHLLVQFIELERWMRDCQVSIG